MRRATVAALSFLTVTVLAAASPLVQGAPAQKTGGEASWRLEQPLPPPLPDGRQPTIPIGLGRIGDIEFWAPNRGLLITAGNPPTIPAWRVGLRRRQLA